MTDIRTRREKPQLAIGPKSITKSPFIQLRAKTSAAGVHQMRLLPRHSLIIVVVVGQSDRSLQPQKSRFSSFENNTGPSDRRTDGLTDRRTDQGTHPLIELLCATKNVRHFVLQSERRFFLFLSQLPITPVLFGRLFILHKEHRLFLIPRKRSKIGLSKRAKFTGVGVL